MSEPTIPQVIPITNKQVKDIAGQRFGILTVIGYVGSAPAGTRRRLRSRWFCLCDCGASVVAFGSALRSGNIRSCGCVRGDIARRVGKDTQKHGMIKTPEYFTWRGMRQRCENPNCRNFPRYGARGIKVCERWIESFTNFFSDMGPRPSNQHSLDRIDNDGDYAPANCRWATRLEQMNNREINKLITHDGVTLPISEWARIKSIRRDTLHNRIFRLGWSSERALTTPVK